MNVPSSLPRKILRDLIFSRAAPHFQREPVPAMVRSGARRLTDLTSIAGIEELQDLSWLAD